MQEVNHTSNPFPGLRPFEAAETHLFFGRDGQSDDLLRRLRRTRFLAVVGTSGSGKSSLVRAGLLPALQGGLMAGAGSDWRIAILRPGGDPVGNLARALASSAVLGSRDEKSAGMQEVLAETTLRRSSLGVAELAGRARMRLDGDGRPLFHDYENLLVVVDQFEEIFRFKQLIEGEGSQEDAAAFVKLLLEAARRPEAKIYVVLTMRSDFLGDCAQFRGLPEAINDGQYLIPRMTRDERREAVAGPVAVGGGAISEQLVNQLLNDVGDSPDQLPILQHALMRAWDYWLKHRRDGEPIGLEHYGAIGTMSEALSLHADEAWNELPDERSRRIAELLFKAITERGTDNREVRRPTRLSEICEVTGAGRDEVVPVIELFRRGDRSFLMPPAGTPLEPETVIDISHESLIRNWERLKEWVNEESQAARTYRRLAEAAVLQREGQAAMLIDPALQLALDWRERQEPNAAWGRRYHPEFDLAVSFLDASREHRDAQLSELERQRQEEIERERREREQAERFAAQQARSARRLRWLSLALVLILLMAVGTAVYALRQRAVAYRSQAEAQRSALKAQAAQRNAEELNVKLEQSLGALNREKEHAEAQGQVAREQERIAKDEALKAGAERKRADEQTRIANERALTEQKAREAMERAQATEKITLETNEIFRNATSLHQQNDDAKAAGQFQAAFEGFRKLHNIGGMADAYAALGEIKLSEYPVGDSGDSDQERELKQKAQREQAVKYLDEAAGLYRRIPDHLAAARTFVKLGESFIVHTDRGHRLPTPEEKLEDLVRGRPGIERFEEALKDFEAAGDETNVRDMLTKISEYYNNFKEESDRRKAIGAYLKLAVLQANNAALLLRVSQLYFALNEKERGDEYVDKVVAYYRGQGDTRQQSDTLVATGEFVAVELKDYGRARAYFEKALKLCREECKGDELEEAYLLTKLGKKVGDLLKDNRGSVGYFDSAIRIYYERGEGQRVPAVLYDISHWFAESAEADAGDEAGTEFGPKVKFEMAIRYLRRALAIYQDKGELLGQGSTVEDIADVYEKAGETRQGLEALRSALALYPPSYDGRPNALRKLAKLQSKAGEKQRALETYGEALAFYAAKDNEQGQAIVYKELGELQAGMNQPRQAIDSYQQSLLLFDRRRDSSDGTYSIPVIQRDMNLLHQMLKRQKPQ